MDKRTRLCACCLGALFILVSSAAAIQRHVRLAAKLTQKFEPVCTEAQAKAYVAELLPLVESAAGRKFKKTPYVKLISQHEMLDVITRGLLQRDKNVAYVSALKEAKEQSESLLGWFDRKTRMIYIVPENITWNMVAAKVDRIQAKAFAKLTIAHEMTHALQDQNIDVAKIERLCKTTDQEAAVWASFEGHATFIQDKVAEALKLEDSEKEFMRIYGTIPEWVDPAVRDEKETQVCLISEAYLNGKDFVAWVFAHGGSERVWEVLKAPPSRTSMIFHPETYLRNTADNVDHGQLLDGLETRFPVRKWSIINRDIGEMELRAMYADLDQPLRDAVFADFEYAQALTAKSGSAHVTIGVRVFRDGSILPDLIAGIDKMYAQEFSELKDSSIVKVTNIAFRHFDAMQSDASSEITNVKKKNNSSIPEQAVHIVRGRVMVEIFSKSIPLSKSCIAEITESVFAKVRTPPVSH